MSQPYVYALFPDKRALFLACHDWTTQHIKDTLASASATAGVEEDAEQALGRVYRTLLDRRPHQVLFQVQAHAAATADPVIRAPVRQRFMEIIELSERLHDAPREVVLRHVGRVMLGNVAVVLDLPPEFHPALVGKTVLSERSRGDSLTHCRDPLRALTPLRATVNVSENLIGQSIQRKARGVMTSVFRALGVSVSFGGVRAVAGVDLEIADGELVGLIGPNGAGKTTFIDAITGFVRYQGRAELGGARLDGLPPYARARLGLARTWQTVELFDDLTVRENLTVAAKSGDGGSAPSVDAELELLDLTAAADAMPWELSQAERKRAGIGRALVARPRLLCLDEPAAGLDAQQSRELGTLLPGIASSGTAVLLVDHDMGLVLSTCHRVVVLDSGSVIAAGSPSEIRGDERVIAAYLGHSAAGAA